MPLKTDEYLKTGRKLFWRFVKKIHEKTEKVDILDSKWVVQISERLTHQQKKKIENMSSLSMQIISCLKLVVS